ncbi:MAG: hypothetical protein KKA07_17300 [Bacteroidetes bacterium]|nr:hypothetical protein [Bacteroidota bacterium]MBU1720826.1 hypothetical protein [Bacteroidota bacterium]
MRFKKTYIGIVFILLSPCLRAQENLDSLLNLIMGEETEIVAYTFKSTRIISTHSIERMQHRDLDFRVSHRFGKLNSGSYNFFGLDQSNSQLGLEYGVTDWLMVGIGRGTFNKTVNSFAKFSLLRQKKGGENCPVSLSLFSGIFINTTKFTDTTRLNYFTSRLSFANQILIARKFNERLSLQFSPTMIHRNLVPFESDPNDLFAAGFGGRYKFSNRFALTFEYFAIFPKSSGSMIYTNPLSIGVDIETGSHVFQIFLSNCTAMAEPQIIGESDGLWLNGDIHLGFNISRVFTLKGKEFEEKSKKRLHAN